MGVAIDADELFRKIRSKGSRSRGTVTMYVDKALFSEFQKICEAKGVSASRVLEETMREFKEGTVESPLNIAAREIIALLPAFDETEMRGWVETLRAAADAKKAQAKLKPGKQA